MTGIHRVCNFFRVGSPGKKSCWEPLVLQCACIHRETNHANAFTYNVYIKGKSGSIWNISVHAAYIPAHAQSIFFQLFLLQIDGCPVFRCAGDRDQEAKQRAAVRLPAVHRHRQRGEGDPEDGRREAGQEHAQARLRQDRHIVVRLGRGRHRQLHRALPGQRLSKVSRRHGDWLAP